MSLCALFARNLVCQSLAEFLSVTDLAQVQALSPVALSALEGSSAWLKSASAALPTFQLCPDLLGTANRSQFLALMKTLASVSTADGCEIPLASIADAQKMSKMLTNVNKAAAGHLAKGGSTAHIALAKIHFDSATIEAAFESARAADRHGGGETDLCFGTAVTIPGTSGRGGGAPLRLHFGWQDGALMLSARDDDLASSSIDMPQDQGFLYDDFAGQAPLTLDLMSVSTALTLSYRGMAMQTNSPWQAAASGIFALTRGKAAARDALTRGLVCVICVRDGMPEHSTYLAKTLHLDNPQR